MLIYLQQSRLVWAELEAVPLCAPYVDVGVEMHLYEHLRCVSVVQHNTTTEVSW